MSLEKSVSKFKNNFKRTIAALSLGALLFSCPPAPTPKPKPLPKGLELSSNSTIPEGEENFSVVVLPDTQHYPSGKCGGRPDTFYAQINWAIANQPNLQIPCVLQLGDIVDDAEILNQWAVVENAADLLDIGKMPYLFSVGNNDQYPDSDPNGTENYNSVFGKSRDRKFDFGCYGEDTDNSYLLFNVKDYKFVALSIEYNNNDPSVLEWADQLLKLHSDRNAIIMSHGLFSEIDEISEQGNAIYNKLKENSNLLLMLGGHIGAEEKIVKSYNDNLTYFLLSDYQSRDNGGDGWLRVLTFCPAIKKIKVSTYSPTLDKYETDNNSNFSLEWKLPLE